MTEPRDGLESSSGLLADRVKEARRREGLTTKTLAERCASLGAPQVTAAVLMNIESGRKDKDGKRRRDITVEELLVLAYALKVSPLTLLLPEDDTDYLITPDIVTSARAAYEWIVGERRPPLPTAANPVKWTDEDRAGAWFVFTRTLRYVSEPSANWQVNNALEQVKDHDQRRELESEKHHRIVEAQLNELRERLDQLTTGGENGKPEDQNC